MKVIGLTVRSNSLFGNEGLNIRLVAKSIYSYTLVLTDGFYSSKSDAKQQEETNDTGKLSQNLVEEESGFNTASESSERL